MNRTRRSPMLARRPGLRVAAVLVLLAAGLVWWARVRSASAPEAWPEAAPGRVSSFYLHLDGQQWDPAREARRRSVIVLNAWDHPFIAEIKAANPRVKVLVYKDLSSTRTVPGAVVDGIDTQPMATGVGWAAATRDHPDWFVRDANGQPMQWTPWPGHWQMDIGNPDYQAAWLADVEYDLQAYGFDGVWADNALTTFDAYLASPPPKYPTDEAVQAATRSMLAKVGSALQSGGWIVIANIADSRLHKGLWADWLSLVSGGYEEHFASVAVDGGDLLAGSALQKQLAEVSDAERAGKWMAMRAWGPDDGAASRQYAVASYLLVSDGSSSIAFGSSNTQPPFPEMQWDLGEPAGAYRLVAPDLYRRVFANGVVLVYATPGGDRSPAVTFDRPMYRADGSAVTRLTLQPRSAEVLFTSRTAVSAAEMTR